MTTEGAADQSASTDSTTAPVASGNHPDATGVVVPAQAMPPVLAASATVSPSSEDEVHYATGDLRPDAWVRAVSIVLGTASALGAAYLLMTEINLARYYMAATMWTRWLKPEPETFWFLVSPLATSLLLLPTIIGAGISAYYLARGASWARWVALGAGLTSGLSFFIHWSLAPLCLIAVLGAVGCFLPRVTRFCQRVQAKHAPAPQFRPPRSAPVQYGPVKRFG